MISSCTEYPGLLGVEADVEDSEVVDDLVALQNLHGNNQGIHHQIVVHHAVEDVYGA